MTPEILFLKQEDVIRAGALDMPLILELAESLMLFFLSWIWAG